MSLQVLLTFVAIGVSFCQANNSAEFLDKQLAFNHRYRIARHLEDSTIGYDNHTDRFYNERINDQGRNMDLADGYYKRQDFLQVKITGTNHQDLTNNVYPFLVGQKALGDSGVMADRWDVKVDSLGQQYIGLYHGVDTFVLNRMRSHLLQWLGNGIKDYLPILDRTLDDLGEHTDIIFSELIAVIKRITTNLGRRIKNDMDALDLFEALPHHEKQELIASGSLIAVSRHFIVIVNMGDSRVLTYDNMGALVDQTSDEPYPRASSYFHGDWTVGRPFVKIVPRNHRDDDGNERVLKYIILETTMVASLLDNNEVAEVIHDSQSDDKKLRVDDALRRLIDLSFAKASEHDTSRKSQDISSMIVHLERDD